MSEVENEIAEMLNVIDAPLKPTEPIEEEVKDGEEKEGQEEGLLTETETEEAEVKEEVKDEKQEVKEEKPVVEEKKEEPIVDDKDKIIEELRAQIATLSAPKVEDKKEEKKPDEVSDDKNFLSKQNFQVHPNTSFKKKKKKKKNK